MKKSLFYSTALSALLLFSAAAARADDYVITLKDHQFSPKELSIPAGQKVKVTVKNMDSSPAEFESHDLNREKVVSANSEVVIFVGPLNAGSYNYFDEFHPDAKGTITAK